MFILQIETLTNGVFTFVPTRGDRVVFWVVDLLELCELPSTRVPEEFKESPKSQFEFDITYLNMWASVQHE